MVGKCLTLLAIRCILFRCLSSDAEIPKTRIERGEGRGGPSRVLTLDNEALLFGVRLMID